MRALILAAGRGTRLGLPGDGPKCLAEIGERTLLSRSLDALDASGIPVTIVVGHAAPAIEEHISARKKAPALVVNDRYREGSVVSLATGLAAIPEGDVLLLDGDVAYTPEILSRIVESKASDALAVDVGTEFTDEQFMAGMRGDRVVTLRRGPVPGHDAQGEWIGFTKLSARGARLFLAMAVAQVARGETSGGYEDALGLLLGDIVVTAVPTDGLPWVEVDFPDDLVRARKLFS